MACISFTLFTGNRIHFSVSSEKSELNDENTVLVPPQVIHYSIGCALDVCERKYRRSVVY